MPDAVSRFSLTVGASCSGEFRWPYDTWNDHSRAGFEAHPARETVEIRPLDIVAGALNARPRNDDPSIFQSPITTPAVQHAEGDVGGVEPVVADRRFEVVPRWCDAPNAGGPSASSPGRPP